MTVTTLVVTSTVTRPMVVQSSVTQRFVLTVRVSSRIRLWVRNEGRVFKSSTRLLEIPSCSRNSHLGFDLRSLTYLSS